MKTFRNIFTGESITESKGVDQKILNKIEDLTDSNNHTEARIEAAKYIGHKKLVKIYTGIKEIQDAMNELPKEISEFRSRIDNTILKPALKQKNAEAIWSKM